MKRNFLFALLAIPMAILCGCNQEDDINEIFANGQTWHWSSSYNADRDWKNDNKVTETLSVDDKKYINQESKRDAFIIQFSDEGKVEGRGDSFTFTGTWNANGKDNSISISIKANRTPNAGRDAIFYKEISEAKYYRGDSKTIKLFDGAKKHFIQFYPQDFRN